LNCKNIYKIHVDEWGYKKEDIVIVPGTTLMVNGMTITG